MKTALFLFFATGFRVATACDCPGLTVEQAKTFAHVIFRGTITAIKKETVYFQVAQVWKGNVTKVFTIPEFRETSQCIGFWPNHLRVGNDLLVYAYWYDTSTKKKGGYFTDICTRTQFAKDAGEDFAELGLDLPPLELRESHFFIWALIGVGLFGMVGGWLRIRRFPRRSPA